MESPFAALRLRTDAAKRFKRVDGAIAVIWKMLLVAESRFRRMKAPELLRDVYPRCRLQRRNRRRTNAEKVAAWSRLTYIDVTSLEFVSGQMRIGIYRNVPRKHHINHW